MQKGEEFPRFVLQDENGETVDSAMLRGLRYIVFFYSKDNTPGCTKEAVEFTELIVKFRLRNVLVFGVSGDSVESHRRFIDRQGLKVKLLSDPDHAFAKQVGAFGEKMNYGKIVQGTIRSTFLVGKDGLVEEAWCNVKAAGHAQRVLDGTLSHFKNDEVSSNPLF
ncbi:MAG: peroxiredoxin [archaeon]|nr:peroxiredoxin [archaeon]